MTTSSMAFTETMTMESARSVPPATDLVTHLDSKVDITSATDSASLDGESEVTTSSEISTSSTIQYSSFRSTIKTTDYESTSVRPSSPQDVTNSTANTTMTSVVVGGSALSGGEIAAVVISVIIVLVIVAALLWFMLVKKRKKTPLLRVHYKNRDSYYHPGDSLCRDSTLEKSTITMEMQNPACYDAYLPNGKSPEGLSRPPSLCAHEDALMFTLAQTNNNATLISKEDREILANDTNGGSKPSNGDVQRESIGTKPELFTGTNDLLGEIMVTVDSMHHLNSIQCSHSAGDASESDKQSLTSISVPSDVASSPPKTDAEEASSTLSDRSHDRSHDSPDEVAL